MGAAVWRELTSQRRERERGAHRETHKENISQKFFSWKMRGNEFLQSAWLKAWRFKDSRLGWAEPRGHWVAPGERAGKQPGGKEC